MKIAVDPGHGMSNKSSGVFDSGATATKNGVTFREADITLQYGLTLRETLIARGADVFMTRSNDTDPAPVGTRASRAAKAGCEMFVALHLNADDDSSANGVEVEYRDDEKDKPLADRMLKKLVSVSGFHDHGNDKRPDLAVLKFAKGPAILVELGFITNDGNRTFLLDDSNRIKICRAIADILLAPK